MTAAEVLREAAAAGVDVRADGADLVLAWDGDPPARIVEMLRRHKAAVIEHLTAGLDAEAFGERAAMREYEGELPRAEAEVAALRDLGAHDAAALLEHLRAHGPQSYGAAATDLGWGATRACQAQGALARLGLIQFDDLARAAPLGWCQ